MDINKILRVLYNNHLYITAIVLIVSYFLPVEEGSVTNMIMSGIIAFCFLFILFDLFYLKKKMNKNR